MWHLDRSLTWPVPSMMSWISPLIWKMSSKNYFIQPLMMARILFWTHSSKNWKTLVPLNTSMSLKHMTIGLIKSAIHSLIPDTTMISLKDWIIKSRSLNAFALVSVISTTSNPEFSLWLLMISLSLILTRKNRHHFLLGNNTYYSFSSRLPLPLTFNLLY